MFGAKLEKTEDEIQKEDEYWMKQFLDGFKKFYSDMKDYEREHYEK